MLLPGLFWESLSLRKQRFWKAWWHENGIWWRVKQFSQWSKKPTVVSGLVFIVWKVQWRHLHTWLPEWDTLYAAATSLSTFLCQFALKTYNPHRVFFRQLDKWYLLVPYSSFFFLTFVPQEHDEKPFNWNKQTNHGLILTPLKLSAHLPPDKRDLNLGALIAVNFTWQ